MSMTLGRFSTSEDPDAGSLRQSGDEVRFESMIVAADLNEFKARVQQLRGLVDNDDERVFPFTWSEDSTFDGFYTDLDVEVNDQPAMLASFSAPFSVRMRRVVGGFARPRVRDISVHGAADQLARRHHSDGHHHRDVRRPTASTTSRRWCRLRCTPPRTARCSWPRGAAVQLHYTYLFCRPADTYNGSRAHRGEVRQHVVPDPRQAHPAGHHGGNWRISNGYCRSTRPWSHEAGLHRRDVAVAVVGRPRVRERRASLGHCLVDQSAQRDGRHGPTRTPLCCATTRTVRGHHRDESGTTSRAASR
jgi:hypothetical protein